MVIEATKQPKAADGHFVLAYHYLTLGHQKEAVIELQDVQKLLLLSLLA